MAGETLVRMPKLADTLVEGTLGRWLKKVGEHVSQGEALASIETDKVTTDLTSPAEGTLLEALIGEGQTVPVETPIARIGEASVSVTDAQPGPVTSVADAQPGAVASVTDAQPGPVLRVAPPKPTPVAERLLAEHGLTPDQVPAKARRLKREDVLAYVSARRPSAVTPLTSMRRAIAEHMTKARQTIPHGQTVMDADLTEVVAWREAQKNAFEGGHLTFTVLFVHALARQLAKLSDPPIDIGIAVAIDTGLIVPVLRNVNSLDLGGIARGMADLAGRARSNQLRPDDVQGARMTVTNVGSFGNITAAPIIPLGQIGILGPGLVERRPLPTADGGIRPGWRCRLCLMFDRRVFDDYAADRFLAGVVSELMATPALVR